MASYAHAFPRYSDLDAPGWRPGAAPALGPAEDEEAPATVRSVGTPRFETVRVGLFQAPETPEALDASGDVDVEIDVVEETEPRTLRSDEIEIRAAAPRVLAADFDPASHVYDDTSPDPLSAPARRPLESGIVPASMIDAIERDESQAAPLATRLRGLVSRVGAAAARFVA